MGWPDSGMLWREDAKPAQEQYADVARAISQFEPVVMMANPEVSSIVHYTFDVYMPCWLHPAYALPVLVVFEWSCICTADRS